MTIAYRHFHDTDNDIFLSELEDISKLEEASELGFEVDDFSSYLRDRRLDNTGLGMEGVGMSSLDRYKQGAFVLKHLLNKSKNK